MKKEYPEKTCDISNLVKHPKSVEAVINGTKTQQRRNGVYAYPNDTFELNGVKFIVTDIKRQSLGEMTDADAIAEGYPSLDAYKNIILSMHHGMTWDNNSKVWVHYFRELTNQS